MLEQKKIAAYIDGANLHKGIETLGWKLDYQRFRTWLKDKYGVEHAYIFLGMMPENIRLYEYLQRVGFLLIFKEVVNYSDGRVKGNCDADLVLQVVVDYFEKEFSEAVIVSSDGDYARLVKFLAEKNSLRMLVSPSNHCSFLLRKANVPIVFLDTQKGKLAKQS